MAEPNQERARPHGGDDQPYADPEDTQFGKAATQKQEAADRVAAADDPDRLSQADEGQAPRPGSKAEPQ
jgi:hypothetical protein